MKRIIGALCTAAAVLLCSCSMPDFAKYPAAQSRQTAYERMTMTLALPQDAGEAMTDAAQLFCDKAAELSDKAVSVTAEASANALERFLSGDAQAALLPLAEIAPLSSGLDFLESPFVFRDSARAMMFLGSPGNTFSDNEALQKKLGGSVAAVYMSGGAGLLSRGTLASDEYLTDARIGALEDRPGNEIFYDIKAQSVTEYAQSEIFDALIRGEITQGELAYGAAVPPLPGVSCFYALDQRIETWWLLIKTGGASPLPEDIAELLRNAAAYITAPVEAAAETARTDTLETMKAMGITVIDNQELEYYFYSAIEVYWAEYAKFGLPDDMFKAIYSVIS